MRSRLYPVLSSVTSLVGNRSQTYSVGDICRLDQPSAQQQPVLLDSPLRARPPVSKAPPHVVQLTDEPKVPTHVRCENGRLQHLAEVGRVLAEVSKLAAEEVSEAVAAQEVDQSDGVEVLEDGFVVVDLRDGCSSVDLREHIVSMCTKGKEEEGHTI
jgi:hypothetical protein